MSVRTVRMSSYIFAHKVRTLTAIATLFLVLSAGPQLLSQSNAAGSPAPTAAAPQPQSEAPRVLVFDVISVRRAKNPQMFTAHPLGDGYSAEGISITWLIMSAYGIPTYQTIVGAPRSEEHTSELQSLR